MQTMEQDTAVAVKWNLEGKHLLNPNLIAQAKEVLATTPFPTTRTEAWKYTRVAKLKNANFTTQTSGTIQALPGIDSSAIRFVFVNGHFSAELSATSYPDGIKILALSQMDEEERFELGKNLPLTGEIFSAFNTAYATDGIYIHVSAKMIIDQTIEIVYVTTGESTISHVRNYIAAEAFSSAKIIQHFLSVNAENGFTNVVTEINVARNAKLVIDKLQEENESQTQIATENVSQGQDSNFTINTITLNGGLVRNNLTIAVDGSNCETHLNGAYILKGNQHVDNHTIVDHKVAHCESNELYKGVIDGNATAVFNGKVFVRKDAQKINAFQSNGNVLMSLDATVNSKPELEIYADDVKCSHGSTTGQLDEEAIFYLRARGISEKSARQLMVGAFVEDVFDKIENEGVKERIHEILRNRFDWAI